MYGRSLLRPHDTITNQLHFPLRAWPGLGSHQGWECVTFGGGLEEPERFPLIGDRGRTPGGESGSRCTAYPESSYNRVRKEFSCGPDSPAAAWIAADRA